MSLIRSAISPELTHCSVDITGASAPVDAGAYRTVVRYCPGAIVETGAVGSGPVSEGAQAAKVNPRPSIEMNCIRIAPSSGFSAENA